MKDVSKAIQYLAPSCAAGGIAEACYDLAALYFRGGDLKANPTEAVKWLQVGAAMGDADSQCALVHAYLNGRGVPQSHFGAYVWARIAARPGPGRCTADTVAALETKITPDDISRGKANGDRWVPVVKRTETEFGYPRIYIEALFGPMGPLSPVAPQNR